MANAQPATLEGMSLSLKTLLIQQPGPLFENYEPNLTELQAFYAQRQYAPAWNTQNPSQKQDLLTLIDALDGFTQAHGVENPNYPSSMMKALIERGKPEDEAKIELLITDWLIKIAHDLAGDKVNLSELYVGWDFKKPNHFLLSELAAAIKNGTVQDYFTSLTPSTLEYKGLMEALKTYRAIKQTGDWPIIPTAGASIKPEMIDPRLEPLRARLAAEGYTVPEPPSPDPNLYTADLKSVVVEYQARNGLEADGNIGPKTLDALNVTLRRRINQIRANMERLRHMPEDFPERYVLVNIASSSVKIIDKGVIVYHAPVVVGRTDRKTPFLKSMIRSVIFNPSWHVPAKIAREDILPKLRKDPHYLEKMGFVINSDDENDPYGAHVDWKKIEASEFAFRLRQAPGDTNSLGRIKFDFDNRFSVYMHGTPHEELFARASRHLSSGCIRLQNPEIFATFILAHNTGDWTQEKVQVEIDKTKTHWMQVTEPMPLYVIYQTVFVPTQDSPVNFRSDDYNYDRILLEALAEADSKKL